MSAASVTAGSIAHWADPVMLEVIRTPPTAEAYPGFPGTPLTKRTGNAVVAGTVYGHPAPASRLEIEAAALTGAIGLERDPRMDDTFRGLCTGCCDDRLRPPPV